MIELGISQHSELFPNEINPNPTGRSVYEEIFSRNEIGRLNQHLVGQFFKEAVEIDKTEGLPQDIKDGLRKVITPDLLEIVLDESSNTRWEAENVEALLHAYVRFQTIEQKYGETEARTMHRKMAQELIYEREADFFAGMLAGDVAINIEGVNRGRSIHLSVLGHELAQIVTKNAYVNTSAREGTRIVIASYYRDHALMANRFGGWNDPDGNFATTEEKLAHLGRFEGSPRSPGAELDVMMKINNKGELSLFPATPNIGGHLVASVGFAVRGRLDDIRAAGIVHDKPERAGEVRRIQLDKVSKTVLISCGEGAYLHLLPAFELAANYNAPAIFFIQNNVVEIGVEQDEVVAQPVLAKKGHGKNIPGVRIEATDMDGMYLATDFATKRAARDAGSTIVEVMTVRSVAHSNAHGDHLEGKIYDKIDGILNSYIASLPGDDPRADQIRRYFIHNLVKASLTDNQIELKKRLTIAASHDLFSEEIQAQIAAINAAIIDPYEVALLNMEEKGYITSAERQAWKDEAFANIDESKTEVMKRPTPTPEIIFAPTSLRLETPHVTQRQLQEMGIDVQMVYWNGSDSIKAAIDIAMGIDQNVLLWGPDVNKGRKYDVSGSGNNREVTFADLGGYFLHEDGIWLKYGDKPMRVMNTPIAERDVMNFALGFSTTRTDPESLAKAYKLLVDLQYADYADEGYPSLQVLGDILFTTGGQLNRPVTLFALNGAVAAGGTRHSRDGISSFHQVNANVDIMCTSDPRTTFEALLYNLLYNKNPTVFLTNKRICADSNARRSFEIGRKLHEPGQARLVKEGKGTQVITYGPAAQYVEESLALLDERVRDSVGVLDLVSIRPFPMNDTYNFLYGATGDILIVHEEPESLGFGNQINKHLTNRGSKLRELTRQREVDTLAGLDVPAIACDGVVMNSQIPNPRSIAERITQLSR